MQVTQSLSPSFAPPVTEAKATKPSPLPESPPKRSQTAAASTSVTLSPEGRAAAATALEIVSAPSNAAFDFAYSVGKRVMDLGGQAITTLRPVVETAADIALDTAYLAELTLGFLADDPRSFTKAEYVEQYDVGALLGYIRDTASESAQAQDSSADFGSLDTALQEGWHKLERWVDRLNGPKMEYTEYVAGGAAVGYLFARIANAVRQG